jgi:hypothetical protein
MRSYDSWITEGTWHTCICGERWCDADGGPCHDECKCGAAIELGEEKCESCLENEEGIFD